MSYERLFSLLDHSSRGYVTIKQIRFAILQPTVENTANASNIYEHCILTEPRIFMFMLDIEFLQSQLLDYESYYLNETTFVKFMEKLHETYKSICDDYVVQLYQLCEKIILQEEEQKDSDDSNSECDERKANDEMPVQQPKNAIKWLKFKSLVTKNKLVKNKIKNRDLYLCS